MADTRPERRFTRIDRLPPYVFNITAELKMAARRRGEDIIDFSMGNLDGATPPHIVENYVLWPSARTRMVTPLHAAFPRLRRAISRWYQDRYDVEIDPESEAIVTIGSKEGLAHLMLATLDHGDTVLVPNQVTRSIFMARWIAGGTRYAQCRWWKVSISSTNWSAPFVKVIRKPKMMILGFPSNPTAQCVELEFFEKVVALAKRYDVLVVHDRPMPISSTMAGKRRQSCRYQVHAMWQSSSLRCRKATTWRAGVSALWLATKRWSAPRLVLKAITITAPLRRCRWRRLRRWRAINSACATLPNSTNAAVMYWLKGLHEAGWMVEMPKASMYVQAKIPEPYAAMGSLEFAKKLLNEAKVCVSPGIGFGDYGDTHVRFALIENRDRIRQAIRGIKAMFRADGLLPASSKHIPRKRGINTVVRNANREPDGSCFSLHSLLLDHQGKSTAQTMTIKEMPIKKYFTFTSLRVITVTPE